MSSRTLCGCLPCELKCPDVSINHTVLQEKLILLVGVLAAVVLGFLRGRSTRVPLAAATPVTTLRALSSPATRKPRLGPPSEASEKELDLGEAAAGVWTPSQLRAR